MNLEEFRNKEIQKELDISPEKFGNIVFFIDFGNVNYWFENDDRDENNQLLLEDEKLVIDIAKLKDFCSIFSKKSRFYYGIDPKRSQSIGFIKIIRSAFGKSMVFTKEIQQIKHYLKNEDVKKITREIHTNGQGDFITIPKCNFDVEISVDAMRLSENYETFCLFSGDSDFISLVKYLKEEKKKKIIIIKGGNIQKELANSADLLINAQAIKKYITRKKQKSSL